MRIAIAAFLVAWAAVFAAVVVEGHSPDSTTAPAGARDLTPQAQKWVVFGRVPGGWRAVRGPFLDAEACLHVSDAFNNQNTSSVFDCDEEPNPGAVPAGRNAHATRTH